MDMPFIKGAIWSQLYKLSSVPLFDTQGEEHLKHPFPMYCWVGVEVCGRLYGLNPELTGI